MIHAYAVLHCDAPGCSASAALREPLRFGQLNPLQCQTLREDAATAGWAAIWGHREGIPTALHFCPEHVPPEQEAARHGNHPLPPHEE